MRLAQAESAKVALTKQLADTQRQIDNLLDRLVEASSANLVSAYEARIEKLERAKIVVSERLENAVPPSGRLEECMELALKFLSSPWDIYKNGDYVLRQTVLRLAFVKPVRYNVNGVYGTPELSLPFKALAGFSGGKSEMVLLDRIELSASPLPRECSTTELQQRRCPMAWGHSDAGLYCHRPCVDARAKNCH